MFPDQIWSSVLMKVECIFQSIYSNKIWSHFPITCHPYFCWILNIYSIQISSWFRINFDDKCWSKLILIFWWNVIICSNQILTYILLKSHHIFQSNLIIYCDINVAIYHKIFLWNLIIYSDQIWPDLFMNFDHIF